MEEIHSKNILQFYQNNEYSFIWILIDTSNEINRSKNKQRNKELQLLISHFGGIGTWTGTNIKQIVFEFYDDWSINSLVATILDKRKDLESIITRPLSSTAEIMSEIPPPHIAAKYNTGTPYLLFHFFFLI